MGDGRQLRIGGESFTLDEFVEALDSRQALGAGIATAIFNEWAAVPVSLEAEGDEPGAAAKALFDAMQQVAYAQGNYTGRILRDTHTVGDILGELDAHGWRLTRAVERAVSRHAGVLHKLKPTDGPSLVSGEGDEAPHRVLERVAQAIYVASAGTGDWRAMGSQSRDYWRGKAEAAIKAARPVSVSTGGDDVRLRGVFCPGCGGETLTAYEGGALTCSLLTCSSPLSARDVLAPVPSTGGDEDCGHGITLTTVVCAECGKDVRPAPSTGGEGQALAEEKLADIRAWANGELKGRSRYKPDGAPKEYVGFWNACVDVLALIGPVSASVPEDAEGRCEDCGHLPAEHWGEGGCCQHVACDCCEVIPAPGVGDQGERELEVGDWTPSQDGRHWEQSGHRIDAARFWQALTPQANARPLPLAALRQAVGIIDASPEVRRRVAAALTPSVSPETEDEQDEPRSHGEWFDLPSGATAHVLSEEPITDPEDRAAIEAVINAAHARMTQPAPDASQED